MIERILFLMFVNTSIVKYCTTCDILSRFHHISQCFSCFTILYTLLYCTNLQMRAVGRPSQFRVAFRVLTVGLGAGPAPGHPRTRHRRAAPAGLAPGQHSVTVILGSSSNLSIELSAHIRATSPSPSSPPGQAQATLRPGDIIPSYHLSSSSDINDSSPAARRKRTSIALNCQMHRYSYPDSEWDPSLRVSPAAGSLNLWSGTTSPGPRAGLPWRTRTRQPAHCQAVW